ncbi:gamma-glutamyl-gamma-aminobutyrate hydrolase family protein [Kallotenue papyrolyticum]|uniref:gamma-glutamyl-gamma-aminobutyrate hydrolase family protein n=1 Tax=Kallotenue papyrolyticum TaxID=1325125 RepID=UPI0004785603|nr:gamma-glutamyl-gamma-aminobutyrate hydrolase family protein [Kallotenue papyrolyticum]
MRPLILITCRHEYDDDWSPPLVGVRRGYVDAVLAAGGLPWLLPPDLDETTLRACYQRADGILLTGGADLDPAHYNEARHPALGEVHPERDRVELPLARWAIADDVPLLAICRGMQVLNVALGGTLYQDLPSQYATSIDHQAGIHQRRWDGADHPISLDPQSRLAALLDTSELVVNSLHHQAVREVAPELRVVGHAPDGVIEAVEARHATFAIGVQCHPEQLWQTRDPRWQRVFAGLVQAAAARAAAR